MKKGRWMLVLIVCGASSVSFPQSVSVCTPCKACGGSELHSQAACRHLFFFFFFKGFGDNKLGSDIYGARKLPVAGV